MPYPVVDDNARSAVRFFAKSIVHGDATHRAWLLEAAENFVNGKELPAVRPSQPIVNDTKMLEWLMSDEGKEWLYLRLVEHYQLLITRKDIELAMPAA